LEEVCSDVEISYPLVQEFLQMVRKQKEEELDSWINKVAASKVTDLQSFARGLERDKVAVLAGLREDWSQGQVEGQVNRLKLKKREMYGRAKFDLLRKRVLNVA
jgi:transposase